MLLLKKIESYKKYFDINNNIKNYVEMFPLKVKNLNLIIENQKLINNLNFQLNDSSLTVLLGPNGAGKSLLLRLLNGLLVPTSGQIFWSGNSINDTIRKKQAFVFQKSILLRRSVSENLNFVQKLYNCSNGSNQDEMLKMVGLYDKKNIPARLLSVGEQQILSLIRALIINPQLIFLDEPTSNIDPISTSIIESILFAAKEKGVKIIFVTHDILQAKRIADEILFMEKGSIIEQNKVKLFFPKPKTKVAQNFISGKI